jgi:hypothetical protein
MKTARKYAYERINLHDLSMMDFDKIVLIGKIWATAIPNWGKPGKRVRNCISVEKCFFAKECPPELTTEQFDIFVDCPIDHRHFFRFRKKALKSTDNKIRVWESTIQKIDEYIQKYQHLIPEPQQEDAPSNAAEPDPTNISN